MVDHILWFVQANKPYFDVAHAFSAVMSVVAWSLALILLFIALCRGRIDSFAFGPVSFKMKQEAVKATMSAARAWKAAVPGQEVNLARVRATVNRAFSPKTLDRLTGKSILWVDDNPINNELAVRALKKFSLDIEQVTDTAEAITAVERRPFDLVISDMARGQNVGAGYELLSMLRQRGYRGPYFIFAGSDSPEFRREARERGAQLSTNDMLELIDNVVKHLGASG